MRITIIGTGYVGLVTGVCFADKGHNVKCIDNVPEKVQLMSEGKAPIYEPGLEDLLKKTLTEGNIQFSTDLEDGVKHGEIIFFCLPTPQGHDGQADLRAVIKVSSEIGQYFNESKIIVNKSTVPVGTAQMVTEALAVSAQQPFVVVSNPEFLREGSAIGDFMNPDRVVIGTEDKVAADKMTQLYRDFVEVENIVIADIHSSELIKYASNAFLATKISFINQISLLAESYGADIKTISRGMGLDPRIGKQFLQAGIGYGGSCFPKDVAALEYQGKQAGIELGLITETMKANTYQARNFAEKIRNYFGARGEGLNNKKICILGLAFKPETDDVRETPAAIIAAELCNAGCLISAYDPEANDTFAQHFPEILINICHNADEALVGADTVIIATDWAEFSDKEILAKLIKHNVKVLFDGRNIFTAEQLKDTNFDYISVGRGDILKA